MCQHCEYGTLFLQNRTPVVPVSSFWAGQGMCIGASCWNWTIWGAALDLLIETDRGNWRHACCGHAAANDQLAAQRRTLESCARRIINTRVLTFTAARPSLFQSWPHRVLCGLLQTCRTAPVQARCCSGFRCVPPEETWTDCYSALLPCPRACNR